MIRTLLRLVAHVLDGILMIGYLRPLWNLERKTFADSLAGTVVLRTDRPLPFAARRDPLPPLDWERAEIPPWRRSVAVLSVLVCAAGVAMGFSSASVGESGSRACSAMVLPAADVPIGTQPAFGSASVDVVTGGGTETRLGIERQRLTGEPSVTVRWEAIGLPAGSVARFAVLGEDGTPVWSVERDVLADGLSPLGSGEATLLEDGSIGLALSPEAAARYASAVAEGRWEVSVLDDQVTTVCLG
jgi:Mce-associated membrane protein